MDLSDIFTAVLNSAIDAQFRANQYSAQLAKELPPVNLAPQQKGKIDDVSFFPIPNSAFQNVSVNLKLKLTDIVTDVARSYNRIIAYNLARITHHLGGFDEIVGVARPKQLAGDLLANNQKNDDDLVATVTTYLSVYLFHFEQLLQQRPAGTGTADTAHLVQLDKQVRMEIADKTVVANITGQPRYSEILHALNHISENLHPYRNIVFRADNESDDSEKLCNIGINLDMRTFSWANYENK